MECFVDGDAETFTVIADGDERSVFDSDDLQILHGGCLPSYWRTAQECHAWSGFPGNNAGVPEVENRAIPGSFLSGLLFPWD
ncbi:hypothetical protein GCM10009617_22950 [Leifsonia poae]|uniref:Uncharacterized protein n=1 Tax=Leifsonia poae TaxID=110933 RepID=A0A9W6HDU0_9MICO|nr:hypothetical protein GCM10017584_38700 [Leifsonia poae]